MKKSNSTDPEMGNDINNRMNKLSKVCFQQNCPTSKRRAKIGQFILNIYIYIKLNSS